MSLTGHIPVVCFRQALVLAASCGVGATAIQADLHVIPANLSRPTSLKHGAQEYGAQELGRPFTPDTDIGANLTYDAWHDRLFASELGTLLPNSTIVGQTLGSAGAMNVRFNSADDPYVLVASVIFASLGCITLLFFFTTARACYPLMYRRTTCYRCDKPTENMCKTTYFTVCEQCAETQLHQVGANADAQGDDGESGRSWCAPSCRCLRYFGWFCRAWSLSEQEELDAGGLDGWSLMQFIRLNTKIWSTFGLVLFVMLGTLHGVTCAQMSSAQRNDVNVDGLSCLDIVALRHLPPASWIWWGHAGLVWIVVFVITTMMNNAHDDFLNKRFQWLRAIPEPRSTTVMVENIPPNFRSDEALFKYFQHVFAEGAFEVRSAYLVRRTDNLRERLEILSEIQYRKKLMHSAGQAFPGEMQEAEEWAIEEVRREQEKVSEAACGGKHTSSNPEYCSNSGFVTFSSMLAQRLATEQQYTRDTTEFIVSMPPDPSDVIYTDLAQSEMHQTFVEYIGILCLVVLFLTWSPVIVFISGFAALSQHSDAAKELMELFPAGGMLLQGVLSSAAIRIFMALLPTILFFIITTFYRLKAGTWAQFQLQRWYFSFLMIFILLCGCLGRSVLLIMLKLIDHPSEILYMLANSIPMASHFFFNYTVLGCATVMLELLRMFPLVKYLFYKWVHYLSPSEAKALAEPEDPASYGMGARMANIVMASVTTLVFCTVSPLIVVFSIPYFILCRVVYGQQVMFAESRKPDLGGTFWVEAMRQMYFGLALYVVLMVGVLSVHTSRSLLPLLAALSLVLLYYQHRRMAALAWELLPLEQVAEAVSMTNEAPATSKGCYMQHECDPALLSQMMAHETSAEVPECSIAK